MASLIEVDVQWQRAGLVRPRWNWRTAGYRESIDRQWAAPVIANLPEPKIGDAALNYFDEHVCDKPLASWWNRVCALEATGGDMLLRIAVDKSGSAFPWEYLLNELGGSKLRASVCLVRSQATRVRVALPAAYTEPMRVLALFGDETSSAGVRIDLATEKADLERAWASLPADARARVEQPVIADADPATVVSEISRVRPHVVWFSGHGKRGGLLSSRGLVFKGGSVVSSQEFASFITTSGWQPFYAVFLACHSAALVSDTANTDHDFPELYRHLAAAGVKALMGMQSRIHNRDATILAGALFRHLAVGQPLEVAAARARMDLWASPNRKISTAWAIPVVWSDGTNLAPITWASPHGARAGEQLVGASLIVALMETAPSSIRSARPGAAEVLPRYAGWTESRRLWLRAVGTGQAEGEEPISPHEQHEWGRFLHTLQQTSSRMVLPIFQPMRKRRSLALWAETIRSQVATQDWPAEISELLALVETNPKAGWIHLLAHPNLAIAFLGDPREFEDIDWDQVAASDSAIYVLSQRPLPPEDGWDIDQLDGDLPLAAGFQVVLQQSELAARLAVLNYPTPAEILKVGGAEKQLSALEAALISLRGGEVLTARARAIVLSKPRAVADRVAAHCWAGDVLGDPSFHQTDGILERRIYHYLYAAELMKSEARPNSFREVALTKRERLLIAASVLAIALCDRYHGQARPQAIAHLAHEFPFSDAEVPSRLRVRFAWGLSRTGDMSSAERHLGLTDRDDDLLEEAWKHAIWSDILKNQGQREQAAEEIGEAIRLSVKAMQTPGSESLAAARWRAYRQDQTRIRQYLFYERKQAAADYEQLLQEWRMFPDPLLDRVIVWRNYAECLRELAETGDPEWVSSRARGRQLIDQAKATALKFYRNSTVVSELLYEEARFAEREGNDEEAQRLLEECRLTALRTRHLMMLAIAESRIFWKAPKDLSRWLRIRDKLTGFTMHGWPTRVLIDGDLAFAAFALEHGNLNDAVAFTNGVDRVLREHPAFVHGSDARRRARCVELHVRISRARDGHTN